jgi:hypothetical protein
MLSTIFFLASGFIKPINKEINQFTITGDLLVIQEPLKVLEHLRQVQAYPK